MSSEVNIENVVAQATTAGLTESGSPTGPDVVEHIQIDPQLLQQMIMTKNARLIATMVHENAVLEVALEQSRRNAAELQIKYDALKSAYDA